MAKPIKTTIYTEGGSLPADLSMENQHLRIEFRPRASGKGWHLEQKLQPIEIPFEDLRLALR